PPTPCQSSADWTTAIACVQGSTPYTVVAGGLLPNTTYYIVIDNWPGQDCNFTMSVGGNKPCPSVQCGDTTTQSLIINACACTLAVSSVVSNTLCNGSCDGSVNLTVSNGTPPYTYSWSNGSTLEDPNNLCAGIHTVTITDATGCDTIFSYTIAQPTSVSAIASGTNVTCIGACNGSATISGSGGTLPYTFTWSNGGSGTSVSSLCPGTYTGTVTDANGCFSTSAVTITEPPALTVSTTSTNVTCNGFCDGTATISGGGGTAPLTFTWSTGASGTSISSLCAGTYTGTVTDANGCFTTSTVTITGPPALTVSITSTNATCKGACDGTATISGGGGTAPLTFTWSTGGSGISISSLCPGPYTGTVTDANGCFTTSTVNITEPPAVTVSRTSTNVTCNGACDGTATIAGGGGTAPLTFTWSTGGSGTFISSLCPGTYTGTVTDDNGCFTTSTVTINEPPALTVSTTSTNVTCNGACDGTATISGGGGTAPLTFTWSTGASGTSISSLCPGTYTGTVTDANGCFTTSTVTITEPPALTVSTTSTNVTCNGACDGTAIISGGGGTGPLTFTWSTGGSGTSISSLCPGTYTGTVTDANGCSTTSTVTITEPPVLTASATNTNATCNGACDGTASITGFGGTAPYTYTWSNGSSGSTISNLCAGIYTGTVKDINNCQTITTVIIAQPTSVTAIASGTNVTCNGACNGTATISGSGGTPPYTFTWSTGGSGTSISSLCPGTYTGTVTDANG
ncbi:SprB repeat-containing protein, partial [Candidatus Amoebophilus asiaticus]|nr:SprB repeat-containing protein [Candidatus Amoebophilus asiaticus]